MSYLDICECGHVRNHHMRMTGCNVSQCRCEAFKKRQRQRGGVVPGAATANSRLTSLEARVARLEAALASRDSHAPCSPAGDASEPNTQAPEEGTDG